MIRHQGFAGVLRDLGRSGVATFDQPTHESARQLPVGLDQARVGLYRQWRWDRPAEHAELFSIGALAERTAGAEDFRLIGLRGAAPEKAVLDVPVAQHDVVDRA